LTIDLMVKPSGCRPGAAARSRTPAISSWDGR